MEFIYEVDPKETRLRKIEPVALSDLGVRERRDMEQWIVKNPDILGEPLLVITAQFGKFDKSARRLDLLALDQTGTLVVVEMKLDARGTHADLQAIRYAAFCSTATPEQVIEMLAKFEKVSIEEAKKRIELFVDEESEFLRSPPRIILAAGSFDDQEITASVLWLRNFALDMSCVELTPYRLGEGKLVLVPKVIIPLPETKDYQVRVEQKKASETRRNQSSPYAELWQRIADEFNQLNVVAAGRNFTATPSAWRNYFQVYLGHSHIHYEWQVSKRAKQIRACIHFETSHRQKNLRLLQLLRDKEKEIARGVAWPFEAAPWGEAWAAAFFSIPYSTGPSVLSKASDAAHAMQLLIERTWPLLQPAINK
ncbi:MAG: hypothetical protein AMQ22_01346 [Candidatus Methanofastidiosum methylothiophilum]|uniref:Endonuclease NucS n=1 Tax=Candidatus Methanofastidiosum methylothiophilum TaxID=1705564 RepID=A0A150J1V6_9EURY|nr:MAG: hypothetical protein AMQ22_01346 [Candidatus Methanofastidiosum methylthiophilus]